MIQGRNRAWKRTFAFRDDTVVARLNTVMVGVVKDNDDPQRMGRLRVWIPELGGDPNNDENWFIVSYASPFAGATSIEDTRRDGKDMASASRSYGWWSVPPDSGNEVLVAFVNGDPAKGFWFACLYQQNMNHMVPGIPTGTPTSGATPSQGDDPADAPAQGVPIQTTPPPSQSEGEPPVVEYNRWSDVNPQNAQRPINEPIHNALQTQGLANDPQRGTTSSGARRSGAAQVYGFLTPGGNSVYADDGEDPHIRMRTQNGTQILINDTTGFVYINSKLGNSWLQVSDHAIDVFSAGTINLRSESSVNIRADGSLNLEAVGNVNIRSGADIVMSAAGNIGQGANGNHIVEVGGTISGKAGANILEEAAGNIVMGSGGDIAMGSGGNNIRSATKLNDNTGAAPAPGAMAAPEPEMVNGSVARRMPTHEPFEGHASAGSGPAMVEGAENSGASDGSIASIPSGGQPQEGEAENQDVPATEMDWLVACMIDEAGTEPPDGKAAIAQINKNRMACGGWFAGSTIKNTILLPDQFSGFYHGNSGGRYQRMCPRSDKTCAERRGLKKIAEYKSQRARVWQECKTIAEQVMAGTYQGGAGFQAIRANRRCTMYLNIDACKKLNPGGSWRSWAIARRHVTKIGRHSFYIDRG